VSEPLTLSEIAKHFSDEVAAWLLVERVQWPDGPICPHCGSVDRAMYLEPRNGYRKTRTGVPTYRRVWKCKDCRQQFSVLVGTIFEDSHIPLSKWLLAVHMMCAGKNGVSALELSRVLGIAYRSAWHLGHRIRYAMARPPLAPKLQGVVEADETYIGGKVRSGPSKKAAARARMVNKTPVVALVERGGDVRSKVMKRVTGKNIAEVLRENVEPDATLMTDSAHLYGAPGRQFRGHETVDHRAGEYARAGAHVNTAEGYFSQLKRSVDGTHHHVSEHHLPRYLGEFDFRYNTRKVKDGERTVRAIRQMAGKRLRYRDPAPGDVV
jgi:transposase-like protein